MKIKIKNTHEYLKVLDELKSQGYKIETNCSIFEDVFVIITNKENKTARTNGIIRNEDYITAKTFINQQKSRHRHDSLNLVFNNELKVQLAITIIILSILIFTINLI